MTMQTAPNLGTNYGWDLGEANWKTGFDNTMLLLDAVAQLSVKDKDLATPPGSPVAGDRYIVAASPTGAWAGQAGKLAVYIAVAWTFYAPKRGWTAYVEDEDLQYTHNGTAWAVPTQPVANGGTGATTAAAARTNLGLGTIATQNTNAVALDGNVTIEPGTYTSGRFGLPGALIMRYAEGSLGAPAQVVSNKLVAIFVGRGYGNTLYKDVGSVNFFSDGAITDSSSPGYFTFQTTPLGSTITAERMRVCSDGNVLIGTQTNDATNQLQVAGPAKCGGPFKHGQYTLATLPSAAVYSGALIDVTDATGGPKTCRSDGTNWKILNTTTTVS